MGMGGARKRAKFSHDPNNTAWTYASDKYGQRMLQSQGWTPGASLGARNKSYTKPQGQAHIRVALKDDNLGLGARKGGTDVLQPGLDAFQGLLGRLNGKADIELEKEHRIRNEIRGANYVESKWGPLRFVSGGLLVGDRTKEDQKAEDAEPVTKHEALEEIAQSMVNTLKATEPAQDTVMAEAPEAVRSEKKSRKSKKRREDKKECSSFGISGTKDEEPDAALADITEHIKDSKAINATSSLLITEKEQKRAEKAQRKLERQDRKEAKRAKSNEDGSDMAIVNRSAATPASDESKQLLKPVLLASRSDGHGRQAVRQRYIQQKKMALADPRALNEILMVKA